MPTDTSQADVILNRTNVALARSRRLIQSWLPPPPPPTSNQSAPQQDAAAQDGSDSDSDFEGLDEFAGLGSTKRKTDDVGLPDGALQRRKLASNEKLLEQLLGKKAVAERKKERERSEGRGTGSLRVEEVDWARHFFLYTACFYCSRFERLRFRAT